MRESASKDCGGPRPLAISFVKNTRPIPLFSGDKVAGTLTLNERAQRLADHMASTAAVLRIEVKQTAAGTRILDCGIGVLGGLQAGLSLARVCLAGLADITLC